MPNHPVQWPCWSCSKVCARPQRTSRPAGRAGSATVYDEALAVWVYLLVRAGQLATGPCWDANHQNLCRRLSANYTKWNCTPVNNALVALLAQIVSQDSTMKVPRCCGPQCICDATTSRFLTHDVNDFERVLTVVSNGSRAGGGITLAAAFSIQNS